MRSRITFGLQQLGIDLYPYLSFHENLAQLTGWQLWRLVTPAFLHFSMLHLIFNQLVNYELLVLGRCCIRPLTFGSRPPLIFCASATAYLTWSTISSVVRLRQPCYWEIS